MPNSGQARASKAGGRPQTQVYSKEGFTVAYLRNDMSIEATTACLAHYIGGNVEERGYGIAVDPAA